MTSSASPLLEVDDLVVTFRSGNAFSKHTTTAVDGVSLDVPVGTTYGLVGESGSGKTTLGRAVLGLIRPTAGAIRIAGVDLANRASMATRTHAVFQDPFSSLNPALTVGAAIGEMVRRFQDVPRRSVAGRVEWSLRQVGMDAGAASRRPHEFSGGQRQRIAIARALAAEPRLIVCDEPTSALDVSTQSQIVNLLADLQNDLGLTYLFISHDLAVVRHLSDHIGVLRHGQLVEHGPAEQIWRMPQHDYTKMLLGSVTVPDPIRQRQQRVDRHHGGSHLIGVTPDAERTT